MSVLLPILAGGGSATVITTGVGAWVVKGLKSIAKEIVNDAMSNVAKEADLRQVASDVSDLKVKLAAETGGNSNGLRQAVNTLTNKVQDVQVDVAHLKGLAEGTGKGPGA